MGAMDLLLIHGFPLDRRTWEAQLAGLAGRGRVLAPDLPGFGTSPLSSPAPASMDDYARAVLAFADSQGVKRFAAAGHSMGGYILFALHRLAPERLAGAVFVSTRAKGDTDEGRRAREETAQRALREGPAFLADSMPARVSAPGASAALLDRLRAIMREANGPGVAAASRAMAARPDATAQLPTLGGPTVVIAGRHDRIVPAAESEAMARAIPGARLVWAEGSGHMPMMEEPGLVTDAIAAIL